jgi:hypothetical protein
MPHGKKNYYAMCHNFRPSLTIIMDYEDQYFFENKKKLMSKIFIVPWDIF